MQGSTLVLQAYISKHPLQRDPGVIVAPKTKKGADLWER